jgi:murein peptide amidase A
MNNHRAHDYRFLIRRWRAVARKAGLPLRPLARAGDYPLFYFRSKALQTSGGVYISAGIHGDEPAGTEALISWAEKNAERLHRLPLLLLPCLNPWGLINNRRHDEQGADLNRSFHREDLPIVASVRQLIAPYRFHCALYLHEDYDAQGLYLYEVAQGRPPWAAALLDAARRHIPIEPRIWVDGRKARAGLIRPRIDMEKYARIGFPEALWMRAHHTDRVLTVEAPSEFALEQRILALQAVIDECVRLALGVEKGISRPRPGPQPIPRRARSSRDP